jgi:hypothetical protein
MSDAPAREEESDPPNAGDPKDGPDSDADTNASTEPDRGAELEALRREINEKYDFCSLSIHTVHTTQGTEFFSCKSNWELP